MDAKNPVEYWNFQAKSYDEGIFSSIDEDSTGIILRTLDMFAETVHEGPSGRCVDLGCGAGKYLPALAARFKSVIAYDLSPKLRDIAARDVEGRGLRNVEVHVRDLSSSWFRDGIQDDESECYGFAVMANVMIAPDKDAVRAIMLRNAFSTLCEGGRMLVIVPSLESAIYVGMRCEQAEFVGPYVGKSVSAELLQGIFKRFGIRTKHFLEAEFRFVAEQAGFTVDICEKVTYSWRAELSLDTDSQLPASLRKPSPLPWDWLFLLKKAEPGCAPAASPLPRRAQPFRRSRGCAEGHGDDVDSKESVAEATTTRFGLTLPVLHNPACPVPDSFETG